MLILGLETSCDESSCAILKDEREVVALRTASQSDQHSRFGGVVPELASRLHDEAVPGLLVDTLEEAGVQGQDLDGVAVTVRPGLLGPLLVGLTAAKTLACVWDKPLLAVDHLQAHRLSGLLECAPPPLPWLSLLVSGGHSELAVTEDGWQFKVLGATIDDAAGEAFDKVAGLLGLSYPGGPAISRCAQNGDRKAFDFPLGIARARPKFPDRQCDFSFSGLKTFVRNTILNTPETDRSEAWRDDVAASFESTVVQSLLKQTQKAWQSSQAASLLIGGGVAANQHLRDALSAWCQNEGIHLVLPSRRFCTDNGAMVAMCGRHMLERGLVAGLDVQPQARLKPSRGHWKEGRDAT